MSELRIVIDGNIPQDLQDAIEAKVFEMLDESAVAFYIPDPEEVEYQRGDLVFFRCLHLPAKVVQIDKDDAEFPYQIELPSQTIWCDASEIQKAKGSDA